MLLILTVLFLFSTVSSEAVEIENDESEMVDPPLNVSVYNRDSFIYFLLSNAEQLLQEAKRHAFVGMRFSDLNPTCAIPTDCYDIYQRNQEAKSGVYTIWPRSRISSAAVDAYCDMDDDGGSWTVIQRRGDFDSAPSYFFQDWEAYKRGFGNPLKDFWLGNDNIFALTNQRANSVKFTLSDWEGNETYATYDDFWIDDEVHKYMLHVKGYRGTAGDSFTGANGAPFSTKDRDNDRHKKNCAKLFKGAWWYTACHFSNLNGLYLKGAHKSHADGVEWKLFRGHRYSLKDTVIKIRPRDFKSLDKDVAEKFGSSPWYIGGN